MCDIPLAKVGPILPCGGVLKRASPDGLGEDAEQLRVKAFVGRT